MSRYIVPLLVVITALGHVPDAQASHQTVPPREHQLGATSAVLDVNRAPLAGRDVIQLAAHRHGYGYGRPYCAPQRYPGHGYGHSSYRHGYGHSSYRHGYPSYGYSARGYSSYGYPGSGFGYSSPRTSFWFGF